MRVSGAEMPDTLFKSYDDLVMLEVWDVSMDLVILLDISALPSSTPPFHRVRPVQYPRCGAQNSRTDQRYRQPQQSGYRCYWCHPQTRRESFLQMLRSSSAHVQDFLANIRSRLATLITCAAINC